MHPEQKRIFQSMTPEQKLNIAFHLYHSARELKAAGLRFQNPDWPEARIQEKVRDIFRNAES